MISRKQLPAFLIALESVVIASGLAIYNIWEPYSYRFDEIFSVVASSTGFSEMFNRYILADVHPPLYQTVLWIWIHLFNDTEMATRSLSLIFILGALAIFWYLGRKHLEKKNFYFSAVFFAGNSMLVFYAQETRSFAMMLFLATLLTFRLLAGHQSQKGLFVILGIAILLSLTHYFGLLFALLAMAILLFEHREELKKAAFLAVAGLLSLAWPIIHFTFGDLGAKTGGNFWIHSRGIQTTLSNLYGAVSPVQTPVHHGVYAETAMLNAIIMIGILLFLSVPLFLTRSTAGNKSISHHSYAKLLAVFVLFVAAVILIDIQTPVSTIRNFLVLVPLFSLLAGVSVGKIFYSRPKTGIAVMVLIAIGGLSTGYRNITTKQIPLVNWADATRYIINSEHFRGDNAFYYDINRPSKANYYFKRFSGGQTFADSLSFQELKTIPSNSFLMMYGQSMAKIRKVHARLGEQASPYFPRQYWADNLVVFYLP